MLTKWIDRLAYKLRGKGIDNLMLFITGSMLAVYLSDVIMGGKIAGMLSLYMPYVLKGQVWRLITFIIVPPNTSFFGVVISLYFLYWVGGMLENAWGSTKFTLFYAMGVIGAIIAAIITGSGDNMYLNLTVFLALAALEPNLEILLFFVLPIKIKYIAYVDIAMIFLMFISTNFAGRIAIVFALLNLFLFFGDNFINWIKNWRKYGKQRMKFKVYKNDDWKGR